MAQLVHIAMKFYALLATEPETFAISPLARSNKKANRTSNKTKQTGPKQKWVPFYDTIHSPSRSSTKPQQSYVLRAAQEPNSLISTANLVLCAHFSLISFHMKRPTLILIKNVLSWAINMARISAC